MRLRFVEHAFALHVEPGASVHLPLQELEAMDVTFDHDVAPRQLQGGQNGIFVTAEMLREGGKRRL